MLTEEADDVDELLIMMTPLSLLHGIDVQSARYLHLWVMAE